MFHVKKKCMFLCFRLLGGRIRTFKPGKLFDVYVSSHELLSCIHNFIYYKENKSTNIFNKILIRSPFTKLMVNHIQNLLILLYVLIKIQNFLGYLQLFLPGILFWLVIMELLISLSYQKKTLKKWPLL